ncbi:hypothetical protein D3C76_1743760 [compost metagenome]
MTPERVAYIRAQNVEVMHDDQRQATCWMYGGTNGGISCLPDWMLDAHIDDPQPKSSSHLKKQAPNSTKSTARLVTERYIL